MKHFKKLLLMLCLFVAGVQNSWAWTNYHVEVQDNIPINGVVYQLCHVYTREGKLNRETPMYGGGYVEYSTNLTNEYYASIVGITGSGAIEIPDTILDGGIKYGVKYVGIRTTQGVESREETYTYEFFGSYTATTTCYYYTLTETPVSITASNVTKLTFKGNVTFKGNLTATACTSMEFKKGVTISSDLTCSQLTKFVFEGNFNCTKDNGAHLKCSNLTQIYFMGTTPTLSGSWSQYSTRAGSYITVYLNETQETCNYLKNNATVWNEFKAINVLPDQTVPYRNVSVSIKRGRVRVNNSSTYILKDTEYQVPQYSDFTFEVTKLYGSDYLVKSVKINGVEMLDAMTLTQNITDALSYYSYTISPVINDVYISVEGESIYDRAYAICGNGGTCRWSTQSSTFTPNSLSSTYWLKSSETPPSLIIIPNEGFTLDRLYYNSYDNTYRATDNGDGTFTYQMAADARASVVFREIPPTTTWNVVTNVGAMATFTDKRGDEYEYALEDGDNTVLDNAQGLTMRIDVPDDQGTLLVMADGEDLSSYFDLRPEEWMDFDENGMPISNVYYYYTNYTPIPADKLKAKSWVIELRTSNELVWTLKSSGDMGTSCVNMLMSNGTTSCTINSEKPIANSVIPGSANIPQTLQVLLAPNHSFTVSFNGTDYTESFVQGETVNGLTFYTYTLNPTDNTSLVANGTWLVTFTETPVGQPVDIIEFADAEVKRICVENWDTNGDGELSKAEAAAVTTLKKDNGDGTFGDPVFKENTAITSFDEFQYFTGLTSIETNAFYNCSNLTSVALPPSVTTIGGWGFCKCSALKTISLPESLTSIGQNAFNGSGLQVLFIPKNVRSISSGIIGGLTDNLTSVVVDKDNSYYTSLNGSNGIFKKETENKMTLIAGCQSTTIPEGVTSIFSSGFYYQRYLKAITLPSTLSSIGGSAFYYCSTLESVASLAKTPPTLDSNAFYGIKNTCVLTVPKGTRDAYIAAGWTTDIFKGGVVEEEPASEIIEFADAEVKRICVENWDTNGDGELSKAEAAAVETLKKDNGDEPLGDPVFKGNTNIISFEEFQFFTGLTSVEEYAFSGCRNLTSVIVPKNVETTQNYAFSGCRNLSITLPEGLTELGPNTFNGCTYMKNIRLPESLTTIARQVFYECYGLKSLFIPKNVTSINVFNSALSSTYNLISISVDPENTTYDSRKGCNAIITTATNHMVYGCQNTVIPEDVTQLYGFRGQRNLKSIVIPKSVTSITTTAFIDCTNLTSVVAKGVTPPTLNTDAFKNISANCVLTVPYGTRDAYIAAGWTTDIFKGGIVEDKSQFDTNGDSNVSIADVTTLVNVILGKPIQ